MTGQMRLLSPRLTRQLTSTSLNFRIWILTYFLHDKELYLTGRTYEGNAGFHVVTPFRTVDGQLLLVNRSWVSAYREPETRLFSVKQEQISLRAVLRLPQQKGYFVPENDPANGFWFTLKPEEMAAFLALDRASHYADQVGPVRC